MLFFHLSVNLGKFEIMKSICFFLTVFSLLSACETIGFAQDPPKLDRPPIAGEQTPQMRPIPAAMILSPVTILNLICEDAELRERIKITDRQIEDLKKLMVDLGQQQQAIRQKYGVLNSSKENEDKQRQELAALQKKLMPGIAGVLTPEQMMQYHVTYYLIIGGLDSPLLNIEMLHFLNLNEKQTEKIAAVLKERTAKIGSLIQEVQKENSGTKPSAEEAAKLRTQGMEISRSYGAQAREVLTPEQRTMEAELQKATPVLQEKLRQFLRRRTVPAGTP